MTRKADDDILIRIGDWEIRRQKLRQRRQRGTSQGWMAKAFVILSTGMGLMAVAVVGLVVLVAFLSRPEVGLILLALLRLLLGLLAR